MDVLNALTSVQQSADDSSVVSTVRENHLRQAAQQFEAIFMRQMLKEMRKVDALLDSKDNPLNSDAGRMMQGLYDDTLCDALARQQGMGIAELIVKQLSAQHD
ncbi:MAG TPA: rod-binding protein [Escherichia sp.]|uniref:rod-binding protein n=1 Tax=Pseudescherichia vulneris TaxID=566 RepID=UPI000E9976B8|nr:rod-binding protein [Pseudescherichia vulneris]HBC80798.1 rod-binding protein [Escherichia sp.]